MRKEKKRLNLSLISNKLKSNSKNELFFCESLLLSYKLYYLKYIFHSLCSKIHNSIYYILNYMFNNLYLKIHVLISMFKTIHYNIYVVKSILYYYFKGVFQFEKIKGKFFIYKCIFSKIKNYINKYYYIVLLIKKGGLNE